MKVYIVISIYGYEAEENIEGVFSSLKKAEEYMKSLNDYDGKVEYYISENEIDEKLEKTPGHPSRMSIR